MNSKFSIDLSNLKRYFFWILKKSFFRKNSICVVELTDGFTIDAQEKELVKIQGGIQGKYKSQAAAPDTTKIAPSI